MVNLDAWLPFEARLDGAMFSGRSFDWMPGFYVRTVSGLLSGGRVTRRPLARSGGPGGRLTRGRRDTERSIAIGGFAFGRSQEEVATLADQFTGILPNEEDFAILAFRELGRGRRWTTVSRSTVSDFRRAGRSRFAEFELVLSAPDQRIYGSPMSTSGWGRTTTVTNLGTHRAPVTITVRRAGTADLAGYTITGPGGQVIVERALSSTAHVYSADDGALTVGGEDVSESIARADQVEAPPRTHTFQVSAGAEILVAGEDTYIP